MQAEYTNEMTLEDLGYHPDLDDYRKNQNLDSFEVGRVISEHKERYVVKTTEGEFDAEIIGNLRFSAQDRTDFPAVGDWVTISEYDENKVLIHAVLPRTSIIERQAVGKQGEKQIIATNIDVGFIVQAVDRDFNINRIERYLTICHTSKVEPVIILNKIDLIEEDQLSKLMSATMDRIPSVTILAVSNETNLGIHSLKNTLIKGKTYCLLGSSGVGKSTLLNNLSGKQEMKTSSISSSSNKGRHITTHRQLLVLDNGGILIDNPGMREIGMADSIGGLEVTYEVIFRFSKECKFNDCTHTSEINCAVIEAVNRGEIDRKSYENFLKMERENEHYNSTVAERHQKDKDFGKMVKQFKNLRKSNKY